MKTIFMLIRRVRCSACQGRRLAQTGDPAHSRTSQKIPVVKIMLHPAAEPRPALKYQLCRRLSTASRATRR